MKKFLVIALTVLMAFGFVSCSGETSATEHAKLTTEARVVADIPQSKALATIQGDDIEIHAVKATIMPTWTAAGSYIDYGNLEDRDSNGYHTATKKSGDAMDPRNISVNLGYISQGEWYIKVEAFADRECTKKIFEGETTCYMTDASPEAKVTLWECKDADGYLNIGEIVTPKYSDDPTDYNIAVTLDGSEYNDLYTAVVDEYGNWLWTSECKSLTLTSGSHTYIIQLKEGDEIVAGVAGTFFLEPEGKALLDGELFKSTDIRILTTLPVETYKVAIEGPTSLNVGSNTTFTANASNTLGEDVDESCIRWYVDGVYAESGFEFESKSETWGVGYHTVSVIYENASATQYVQVFIGLSDL